MVIVGQEYTNTSLSLALLHLTQATGVPSFEKPHYISVESQQLEVI
jgi:hypothetical protein